MTHERWRKLSRIFSLTIASKMPTYVLTNQKMRQADAVKCAHVELKEQFVESEDQYVAALKKAAKHLIMQQDEMDQFIFKVTINFINCRLCIWCVAR